MAQKVERRCLLGPRCNPEYSRGGFALPVGSTFFGGCVMFMLGRRSVPDPKMFPDNDRFFCFPVFIVDSNPHCSDRCLKDM